MAFSSGSTLQQSDEVAAVAPGSSEGSGGGGGGGGVSTWDGLSGQLSGPIPFDATDGNGNPVPRGADFLGTSVEVRWERDPADGVALRVRDVTGGNDLLETDEGGLTDVPALNVQDTLTIPEKGDGAGQYIGDADFQLGAFLARDTATDPDTLNVTLQAGTNVTIESDGTINAAGGAGSPTDILEGGTEVVGDATDIDFAGDDFNVSTPNGSEAAVALANDSVTVAGNNVSLGGSTSIGHGDLSNISPNDHHTKYTDSEAVSAVNAESSLSVDITGDADTVDGYEGSELAALSENETFTSGLNITGGSVGIGTTSPSASLEVNGTVYVNSTIANRNDARQERLTFATDGVLEMDRQMDFELNSDGTRTTGSVRWAFVAAGNEKMRIQEDGKVGIGTTSPSDKLEVAGTTATQGVRSTGGLDTFGNATRNRNKVFAETGLVLDSARSAEITGDCKRTDPAKTILKIFGRWNGGTPVAAIGMATGDDTVNEDDGRIKFQTKPGGGSPQTRLQIEPNGNIGIATTSPSFALDVAGRAQATTVEATDTLLIPEK